ncbi:histone-lysine N-methyltransferase SETMAR [Plakobranchus ocellatus]|uniref:Histone-lysine N-methyltransferase SETMAR n=1 Tax=Plakobranchus ocellatus TaxID=259542 RepID=A0AAV4AGG8_9GAST|nr:histone-lysine N-methyltransferase SETMAR [Plakobranchus ocellatus]
MRGDERYGWEILPHPAHSPDLALSDFHLFEPLKRHLGGMAFETEDDLISELRNWFDNLDVDFFRVDYNNRNSSNSSINGNKIKIGSCRSNISSSNTISSNISNSSGIDNSNTSTCGGNGINSIESQTAAASTAACTSSNYTSSNNRISSSMDNGNTSTGGGNKLRGPIVWNHKQQQHLQLRAPSALAAAIIPAVISASAAAWTMAIPALAVVPTVALK